MTYTLNTKMSDLICDNYDMLLIITRFGIPLGFGEKNIGEICKENQVNAKTLLLVINTLSGSKRRPNEEEIKDLSIESLISYLRNSHNYFLNFRLPSLRQQLLSAISNCQVEVAFAIKSFFDNYYEEVDKHMSYEEKNVFPYAESLLKNYQDHTYHIEKFKKKHNQIEQKITDLKNILIKYYPAPTSYELTAVLHDIFASEADLASHNFVEDYLLIPAIEYKEALLK